MKGVELRLVALGFAFAEADREVVEEGENRGERVSEYLANTDPPIRIAAPWCAAFVQYVTDRAAWNLDVMNPLDAVRREALVADYVSWADTAGLVTVFPEPGDLAAFSFGGNRWDHLGFVAGSVTPSGLFPTVEGNTSPGIGALDSEREREGEGVYRKERRRGAGYDVRFLRWST